MKTTALSFAALAAFFFGGFFALPLPARSRPPVTVLNSLVQIGVAGNWFCTGVVVREVGADRLILTAGHCTDDPALAVNAYEIRVQSTGKVYPATAIRFSTKADLTLLYVSGLDLPALPVADHDPSLFESVWLFGSSAVGPNDRPFGAEGFWQGREASGFNQHSAAGYAGQSGGALVNLAGELVGICHGGIPGTPLNVAVTLTDILAFLAE